MAGKLKRKNIYNPAAKPAEPPPVVYDRKSTDIPIGAEGHVVITTVVDPFGDLAAVTRMLRSDPLAQLHSRGAIDEAQYQAGCSYRASFERAGTSIGAIDPSKEYVDGGLPPMGISDSQMKAVDMLKISHKKLGEEGQMIVQEVLIHGWSMAQLVERRGLYGENARKYYGKRFRECLETLAVVYGHSNRAKVVADVSSET